MRNFVLTLTFVSSLLISFLPCRAQFNTVTRDTVPIRLIGQPASAGKVGAVSGEEHGSAAVSSEGSTPLGSEEKFYEMPVMPGVGQGRGGGTQGKEGAVGQDGFHGLTTDAYGQGVVGQGQQDRPQGVMEQDGQQEGKKKGFFRRLFGKTSKRGDDGGNRSRGIFGRRRRQAPQVIIMPVQTVVGGNADDGGRKGRDRIDEYTEDSEDALLFRELKEEDLRRLDLLSQRSTVSMPLQRFYLTSKFGYRKDPLGQGTRFHDGVDLRCSYEPVYAMLPGVVTKVQHGSTGYGNYVVLNHGNIECLYGHLSDIGVEVGEAVQAGDVVAISGNTGRSTGPHLHVKMTYMGQRVDPLVFIDYINDYIHQLQSQLYGGSGVGDYTYAEGSDLTIENLIATMEHYGIHHQSVVLAQVLLETGYLSSSVCRNKHNLFGLTRRDGQYYEFATWQESVKGYRDMIQYRYKGGDYYEFLRRIPYAEDPNYIYKVKKIEGQLGGYGLSVGEGGE